MWAPFLINCFSVFVRILGIHLIYSGSLSADHHFVVLMKKKPQHIFNIKCMRSIKYQVAQAEVLFGIQQN